MEPLWFHNAYVMEVPFLALAFQAPHTRAAERFRATGGRTGEQREDWQGAFATTNIGRAGLIVQGAH